MKIKQKIDSFIIKKPYLAFSLVFLLGITFILIGLLDINLVFNFLAGVGILLVFAIWWIPVPQYFIFHLAKHKNRSIGGWITLSVFLGWIAILIIGSLSKKDKTLDLQTERRE